MKPASHSDDKLIERFKRGDRHALTQVYDLYFRDLCYYAYKITRDMGEAEDITVTSLQILLSRHGQFDDMASLKNYLYITAKNKCLKYLQQTEKLRSHKELYAIQGESDGDEYMLSQMAQHELMKRIMLEIESLSPKRKEVFKLYYIDGLDADQIAEKLKMTPGAVYTVKSRALEQLRATISSKKLSPIIGTMLLVQQLLVY